jgi:DNA recombination protein RmuC
MGGGIFSLLVNYYIKKELNKRVNQNRDIVKSISLEVIKESNEQNGKISEGILRNISSNTESLLNEKKIEIDSMLKPLREEIDNYRRGITEIERSRREDYGNLRQFLNTINETTSKIKEETLSLNQMLKNSQSRGRWGELTLKRIVEMTGMVEHIDFDQQVKIEGGERPDMVIHLPGNREVVVDSKAPYKKYIESFQMENDYEKTKAMNEFASDLRKQLHNLSSKDYFIKIEGSYEFVVMFLPQENMLQSALSCDPDLVEYAMSKKIVICTPLTLFATLKVIQMSWKEESMIKNSGNLIKLSGTIYERMTGMFERVERIGENTLSLVKNYNSLISFSESRVLPSLKKMNQLGELKGKDMEMSEEIDEEPRKPTLEKWKFES